MLKRFANKIFASFAALGLLIVSSCAQSPSAGLYDEIKSVDKMVFASMSISKIPKWTDEGDFWRLEWGKRIAAYSYSTYLRAYIDLSELQIDDLVFDDRAKTVKVTLPPVVTEIVGRDIDMKKEYDNFTGMRTSGLDEKELALMKERANASLMEELDANPIFKKRLVEEARRKARRYFESLFKQAGYTASIDFRQS